ncbi:hypothetical protein [Pacificibacter sp. AS14]|uniref:hypothetical protein n=1 Tax=Pacificibacter sp. AS14 TaxID=3135785 RepID=UPI003174CE87
MDLSELQKRAKTVNDIYVDRFNLERDGLFLIGKLVEEVGEVTAAYLKLHGRARGADADRESLRANFEDEMADVLGFLLVLAEAEGVDLPAAFDKKWGKYLEPKL